MAKYLFDANVDRMLTSTRAFVHTMRNATIAYSDIARRTTRYESRRGVVILNQRGRVVSTWRWSR